MLKHADIIISRYPNIRDLGKKSKHSNGAKYENGAKIPGEIRTGLPQQWSSDGNYYAYGTTYGPLKRAAIAVVDIRPIMEPTGDLSTARGYATSETKISDQRIEIKVETAGGDLPTTKHIRVQRSGAGAVEVKSLCVTLHDGTSAEPVDKSAEFSCTQSSTVETGSVALTKIEEQGAWVEFRITCANDLEDEQYLIVEIVLGKEMHSQDAADDVVALCCPHRMPTGTPGRGDWTTADLPVLLKGFESGVTTPAFLPIADNKATDNASQLGGMRPKQLIVAAGSKDGTVSVFDAANAKRLFTIEDHTASVCGVDFGPQGSLILASASSDKTIRVYRLQPTFDAATLLASLSGASPLDTIQISSSGKFILASGANRAMLWETPVISGAVKAAVPTARIGIPNLKHITLNAVSNQVVGVMGTKVIEARGYVRRVFDSTANAHGATNNLKFLPRTIADMESDCPLWTTSGEFGGFMDKALVPGVKRLFAGAYGTRVLLVLNGEWHVWDPENPGKMLNAKPISFKKEEGNAHKELVIGLSDDGNTLVLTHGDYGHNKSGFQMAEVVSVADGGDCIKLKHKEDYDGKLKSKKIYAHPGGVTGAAFSHDSKYLYTGAACHEVCKWDMESHERIGIGIGHGDVLSKQDTLTYNNANVSVVEVSPDDALVLTAAPRGDRTFRLWDAKSLGTATPVHRIFKFGDVYGDTMKFDPRDPNIIFAFAGGKFTTLDIGSVKINSKPEKSEDGAVLDLAPTKLSVWSPNDYPTLTQSIGKSFSVSMRGTILCGTTVFSWNSFQTAPEDAFGSLSALWSIVEMLDPTPFREIRLYDDVVDKTIAKLVRRFPVLINARQETADMGTITLMHILVKLQKNDLIKLLVSTSVGTNSPITPYTCCIGDGYANVMQSPLQLAIHERRVACVSELVEMYIQMPASQMLDIPLRKPIVEALPRLLELYPTLAQKVLAVPLVEHEAAATELGGYVAINEGDLLLVGRKEAKELGFWRTEIDKHSEVANSQAAEKIAIKTLVVPFPGLSEMYRVDSPLYLAVKHGDAAMMNSPSMQILLKFKWRSFAKKAFTKQAVVYMIFLVWFTAMSICITTDNISKNLTDVYLKPEGNPGKMVAVLPPFGFTLFYLVFELRQVVALGASNYFGDPWNTVDLLGHSLMIVLVILHVTRSPVEYAILSICAALYWSKMLYYFKGNKRLGGISLLTTSMMYSIRFFIVVLAIAVIAFSIIFSSVSQGVPGYESFPKAMLSTYLMMFGEFADFSFFGGDGAYVAGLQDQHWSVNFNHVLAIIYFISFSMLVIILLLNLLIAIMMDSYAIMNEDLIKRWRLALSQLVVEIEVFEVDRATQHGELMAVYPEVIHALCSERNTRWVPEVTAPETVPLEVTNLQAEVHGLKEQLEQVLKRLPELKGKKTPTQELQDEFGHESAAPLVAKERD